MTGSLTHPSRVASLPDTYWLTRDTMDGNLSNIVEVWAVRPECNRTDDGDALWLAPFEYLVGENEGYTHIADLTLDEARALVGNGIPEDSRQCTRVGPEPVAPKGLAS